MNRNHMKRRAIVSLALVCSVGASMALTGCEALGLDGGGEAPAKLADAKKTPAKKAPANEKKAEAKVADEVEGEYERPTYPDNVRRNPFQPDKEIVAPKNIGSGPEPGRPMEPLEQFDISQLKLVAIISSVVVPKAMFVDPKGTGHIVKERDRIGRKGSIIFDIRENEVDIQESISDDEGSSRVRTLELVTDQLTVSDDDGGITDDEREALERLLDSKEGRRQLRERLGGGASSSTSESAPNRGIAPPTQ